MNYTEIFDEQINEAENQIKSLRKEIDQLYIEAVRDGNYKVVDRLYEEAAHLSSIEFKLDKLKMFRAKNNI